MTSAKTTGDPVEDYHYAVGFLSAGIFVFAVMYGVLCSYYNREYLRRTLGE
jgi:hypothetical protein